MKLRVTTWNVNSVRLRWDHLERLVHTVAPDVLCLQETKVVDELFPHLAAEALGYSHRLVHGMKGYNGVAILSRLPLGEPQCISWCDRDDCRHVFATVAGGIEVHNFYLPAGGDVPDPEQNPKFAHKLALFRELAAWWRDRQDDGARRVMAGDLNVAPLETDVWSHKALRNVVTHTPVEIEHLDAIRQAGPWVDAVREIVAPEQRLYSWWSYRARDWRAANRGRRLDHIWVSPALAPAVHHATVHTETRGWERPSDHAPVTVDLAL